MPASIRVPQKNPSASGPAKGLRAGVLGTGATCMPSHYPGTRRYSEPAGGIVTVLTSLRLTRPGRPAGGPDGPDGSGG